MKLRKYRWRFFNYFYVVLRHIYWPKCPSCSFTYFALFSLSCCPYLSYFWLKLSLSPNLLLCLTVQSFAACKCCSNLPTCLVFPRKPSLHWRPYFMFCRSLRQLNRTCLLDLQRSSCLRGSMNYITNIRPGRWMVLLLLYYQFLPPLLEYICPP